MIKKSLKEIEIMCGGSGLKNEYWDMLVQGVSTDTRSLAPSQLFIPLVGENFNGHNFLKSAKDRGAIASLWNRDEPLLDFDFPLILVDDTRRALQELAGSYRSQINMKVIGITGSNGKTSTKDILASLLKTQYKTAKTMGNFNNSIGLPLTLLSMDDDTEMAVLEMGMDDFGQIELLTSIARPDVAIITNIGEAHLEGLLTKDNIARAKLEILQGLNPQGLFLYYGDDSVLKSQIENTSINHKIRTYGASESNDYQAEVIFINERGDSFYLRKPASPEFFLPMLGAHQVLNATAAIAIARYFGVSYENIERGLLNVEKTGMRNELLGCGDFTILNDSYKSNPSSVLAALETLYSMDGYGQKIAVLGDMLGMGDEQADMHREIGRTLLPANIDYFFAFGEFGQYFAETARDNFSKDRVFVFFDKASLVEKIKEVVEPNSLILVKASRPLAMEEVIDKLLASFEPLS